MLLTRHTRACVELASELARIVIDPGEFGTPVDLTGIDAVFITHDHFDHVSHELLQREVDRRASLDHTSLRIFGPHAFAEKAAYDVTPMQEGDRVTVDDIDVQAIGQWQEPGSLTEPRIQNIGYVIDGRILHSGDAYQQVDGIQILLVPLAAPWIRITEIQRNIRQLQPSTLIGMHDIQLGDVGLTFAAKTLQSLAEDIQAQAVWLTPGQSITV